MSAAEELRLEDEMEREAKWQYVAERKGFRCKLCGDTPPLSEREAYFETGYCGYHAYLMAKDD